MERRKGMMREAKMGKKREKYKKNAQGIAHIKNYMYLCRRFERPASDAGIIDEGTGIQCRDNRRRNRHSMPGQ